MNGSFEELEKQFDVPFGLLPGLPNAKVLAGLGDVTTIRRLTQLGWVFVNTQHDYRLLFRHPSGYTLRLGLEMCEETGEMIVMFVDHYGILASS